MKKSTFHIWFRRQILLLLSALMSLTAFAYDFEVDGLYYIITSSDQVGVIYKSYDDRGYSGTLQIPETVVFNGVEYDVTSITTWAFYHCSRLTGSLVIPNSITEIGMSSFEGCTGLTGSLNIPNSITEIEQRAFSNCSGFTSLIIPKSVTSIGDAAFGGCGGLTSINVEQGNSIYDSRNSCNAIIETKSNTLVRGCINTTIPNDVTTIGLGAFSGCTGLTTITIPNNVTTIGSVAFEDCNNLITVIIPNSVTSIGAGAFSDCSSLKTIAIPNSVIFIDSNAFDHSGLTSVTIPNSVTEIGGGAFAWCGDLENVYSNIVTPFNIDSYTFQHISPNASLHIPKGTKSLYQQYQAWTQNFANILDDLDNPNPQVTLSVQAIGNGSASYNGETIRNTKKSYTVDEGTNVTITFSPDDGYRIKSLKVNNVDATVSDSYTTKVNADMKVEVEFEEIPVTTYSLSIKAVGNGSATYKNTTVKDDSQTFTVNEGSDVTIVFTPDDGYRIKSVRHDGEDITPNMIENSYTISDIHADATVEVEFVERVNSFSADGISYQVTSWEGYALTVVAADDGLVLEIPDKISNQDEEWTVTGIDGNVLDDHEILAAIIWNPEALFTARVSNPNLLLYVKDEQYAPATIKNVVVNGYAKSITLTDAQSGNNFYCPEAFTAQSISYTHNYLMKTGLHESRGWETIALPFDVQQISHSSKGEIVPFARWTSGGNTKPFWLYELSGSGFVEAEAIKANTPYIISMPNNEAYPNEYHLNGKITFSSVNVKVEKSDELQIIAFNDRSFAPNFICRDANAGCYALNVSNDYEFYQGSENEGSKFILNLRQIHPFEAYMTTSANTRSIGIFDGMTTAIRGIEILAKEETLKVYDLSGKLLRVGISLEDMKQGLPAGVYIVNHQKIMIK